MADKTIGDLPAASAIYDDDLFLLEQSGEAKNLRGALYKAYLQGFVDAASAASEEAAAALVGVRDAINNIPEGAATPIVNDLTTGGTSMALSAEMGKQLKTELDTRVNPNLLDNWYFGNPVNQRGQTEYNVDGYTIDRWKATSTTYTVSIGDDAVTIAADTAADRYLRQGLERPERLRGKTVTVSMLNGNDELVSATGTVPQAAATAQGTVAHVLLGNGGVYLREDSSGGLFVQLRATKGTTYSYKAVKLELGTQQTLAHQDANGNWVLNEIPDYSEQLLRCCMSTADSSDTYANNKRTPAAINAVNKAGDTMTGNLKVETESYPSIYVRNPSASVNREAQLGINGVGNTVLYTRNVQTASGDSSKRELNIVFPNNTNALNLNDLMVIYVQDASGGVVNYKTLHTGNKPSGSYTGNGSAAERTIAVGGIGGLLLVWCESNGTCALVTPYGAVPLKNAGDGETITAIGGAGGNRDGARFTAAGSYIMKTTHSAINENGLLYEYRVL